MSGRLALNRQTLSQGEASQSLRFRLSFSHRFAEHRRIMGKSRGGKGSFRGHRGGRRGGGIPTDEEVQAREVSESVCVCVR